MIYWSWLVLTIATCVLYGGGMLRFLQDPNKADITDLVIFVFCFPMLVIVSVTSVDISIPSGGVLIHYTGEYWLYPIFWGLSIIDIAFIIGSALAATGKLPSQFKQRLYSEEIPD